MASSSSQRLSTASRSSGTADESDMKHILLHVKPYAEYGFSSSTSIPIFEALKQGVNRSEMADAVRSFQQSGYVRTESILRANNRSEWLGTAGYRQFNPGPDPDQLDERWKADRLMPPMSTADASTIEQVYRIYTCSIATFDSILGLEETNTTLQNFSDLRLLSPPTRTRILRGNMPVDEITGVPVAAPFRPGTFIYATRFSEVLVPNEQGEMEAMVPVMIVMNRAQSSGIFTTCRTNPWGALVSPNHFILKAESLFTGQLSRTDLRAIHRFCALFDDIKPELEWYLSKDGPQVKWLFEESDSDDTMYALEQTADGADGRRELIDRTSGNRAVFKHGIQCTICIGDYEPGSEVSELPCEHTFHFGCIHYWLNESRPGLCPVCRKPVVAQTAAERYHSHMDIDSEGSPPQYDDLFGTSTAPSMPDVPTRTAEMLRWLVGGEIGVESQSGPRPVIRIQVIETEAQWDDFIRNLSMSRSTGLDVMADQSSRVMQISELPASPVPPRYYANADADPAVDRGGGADASARRGAHQNGSPPSGLAANANLEQSTSSSSSGTLNQSLRSSFVSRASRIFRRRWG